MFSLNMETALLLITMIFQQEKWVCLEEAYICFLMSNRYNYPNDYKQQIM